MADRFSFDESGNNRTEGTTGNADSGEPGSNSGPASAEGANNGTGSESGGTEGVGSFGASEPPPKKRRGRKPFPRDAEGNIIRPAAGTGNSSNKSNGERVDIKNDRVKVKMNIAGLHAMAAVLTKQPILNLQDNEATMLTNSLCDVADYHNINLIGAGGAFALYASLATTAYMIYVPRAIAIKQARAADDAKPANPGDYREETSNRAKSNGFRMDFSNDTAH